jgi:hypothetical protein
MALLGGFPAAYVNVVLNTGACAGGEAPDSKFVVDDRPGSEHGGKVVATSVTSFEAAVLFAGPQRLRVLKLKGALTPAVTRELAAVLERHLPDLGAVRSFNAKNATIVGDPGDAAAAAAVLAGVLTSHLPPTARLCPIKKVERAVSEFASVDEVATHLLARPPTAPDAAAADADASGRAPSDPRCVKLKLKAGCLDGDVGGDPSWVDGGVASLGGAGGSASLPLPSDAVCCAAATGGDWRVRTGPVTGLKLRGRLSPAASRLVLHVASTAPTLGAITVVRHTATPAHAVSFVAGLRAVARARGSTVALTVKRAAAGGGKTVHKWAVAGAPADDSEDDAVVAALATGETE